MRPRKAFLLAAGLGTRLKPLSDVVPKPVWPFFGLPMMMYSVHALVAAGVEEIVINLHHLGPLLRSIAEPLMPRGVKIIWTTEDEILGTGGALKPFCDYFADGPFWLVNSDTYRELDYAAMWEAHQKSGVLATLALAPPKGGAPGLVLVDGQNKIVNISGRGLQKPGKGHDFMGVHLVEPEVLQNIRVHPEKKFCINKEVHAKNIELGFFVGGYVSKGFWSDLGTPQSYLAAHRELLDKGKAPPGAIGTLVLADQNLSGGAIKAPSFVGEGLRLGGGSTLGPYAVAGNCVELGGGIKVSSAVVWDGAKIAQNLAGRVCKSNEEQLICNIGDE